MRSLKMALMFLGLQPATLLAPRSRVRALAAAVITRDDALRKHALDAATTTDEAFMRARDDPYTRAIARSGRRGEWRRALMLLDALERRRAPGPVSNRAGAAAVVACDRAGCARGLGGAPRWAEARSLLKRTSFAPDAFAYASAARSCGRAGRADDVETILGEAERALGGRDDLLDAVCAVAMARCGRWDHASALHDRGAARGVADSRRQKTAWRRRSKRRFEALSALAFPGDADGADADATNALETALGAAASFGAMPSFADAAARRGYARIHFSPRAAKFADALCLAEDGWLRRAVARLFLMRPRCDALSLGGGPGESFAALATVRAVNQPRVAAAAS